jgi:3-hydroxyacyl-CoA dehydrogenase/enoyl-CoA hydratase/3-hydroxybutyryl-CoA epimerase
MACHGRVCIDTPAAILGLPEIVLGLLPGAGGTQRLPRYIGVKPAIEMLLVGAPITPQEAVQRTLVDELASADQLLDKAIDLVKTVKPVARWDNPDWQLSSEDMALLASPDWETICHKIGGWAGRQHDLYPAVKAIVDIVGAGAGQSIDDGLKVEWDTFVGLMQDPVVANMVVTGFLNKTAAPKWARNHVDGDSPKPASVEWHASETAPKSLSRKIKVVECGGDVVVANDAGSSNSIRLLSAGLGGQLSSDTAFITYAGHFTSAEAVEIYAPPHLSNGVLTLASAMGKVPVWTMTAGGTLNYLMSAVATTVSASGLSSASMVRAATAIDACPLFGVAETDEVLDFSDRQNGYALLARVALDIQNNCQLRYEALDVLAVLGAGWPKWSGGPVAYLAMLQRNELADANLPEDVKSAVAAIDHALKVKASYHVAAGS